VGEFIFPGVCGREPGVEGRVFWEGLVVLPLEEAAGDGRVLEGLEPREGVVWADGVDGLAVVDERKRTLEDLFIELDLTEDLLLAVTGVG
ncbi:hypothetical protein Tco_1305892, partial [Tanacetum coccineum]